MDSPETGTGSARFGGRRVGPDLSRVGCRVRHEEDDSLDVGRTGDRAADRGADPHRVRRGLQTARQTRRDIGHGLHGGRPRRRDIRSRSDRSEAREHRRRAVLRARPRLPAVQRLDAHRSRGLCAATASGPVAPVHRLPITILAGFGAAILSFPVWRWRAPSCSPRCSARPMRRSDSASCRTRLCLCACVRRWTSRAASTTASPSRSSWWLSICHWLSSSTGVLMRRGARSAGVSSRASERARSRACWSACRPVAGGSRANGGRSSLASALVAYLVALRLDGSGFIAAFVGGMTFGNSPGGTVCGDQPERGCRRGTRGCHVGWLRGARRPARCCRTSRCSRRVCGAQPDGGPHGSGGDRSGGTGARLPTVAFMGWFGPRGLASIVFGLRPRERHPRLADPAHHGDDDDPPERLRARPLLGAACGFLPSLVRDACGLAPRRG